MSETLSLKVKKELLENIKIKYQKASWDDKTRILDAFCLATTRISCVLPHLKNEPLIN